MEAQRRIKEEERKERQKNPKPKEKPTTTPTAPGTKPKKERGQGPRFQSKGSSDNSHSSRTGGQRKDTVKKVQSPKRAPNTRPARNAPKKSPR